MRFYRHGLALGQAGFLDREIVEEDTDYFDVVDRRMNKDERGRACDAALGSGGHLDYAGASGSARSESGVPSASAGGSVRGDVQDGGIAGVKREGGANVISGGIGRRCREVDETADLDGTVAAGVEDNSRDERGLAGGGMSAATAEAQ